MLELIWGKKTDAMMDVWTIEHLLSGISVGMFVILTNRRILSRFGDEVPSEKSMLSFDLVGVMFLAFLWETFEHYLETGLAGERVEFWFQGVEFWANRLIFDPLMLVLGYLLVRKFPKIVLPARILSIIWLVVHVFVFPHSMYLHEIF
ncbi:MAG: hypothetical protein AAF236_04535 [Verrucomicrobiota bacterium]